jgi:hypothetical protein
MPLTPIRHNAVVAKRPLLRRPDSAHGLLRLPILMVSLQRNAPQPELLEAIGKL